MGRTRSIKLWIVGGALATIVALLVYAATIKPVMGPSRVVVDVQSRVHVFAGGQLYVLDHAGAVLARYPLDTVGGGGGASDLAVLPDGDYLVADSVQGDVFRCKPDMSGCQSLYRAHGASGGPLGDSLKVAWIDDTYGLLLADTTNHRVLHLAADGAYKGSFDTQDGQPAFRYPNQIAALDERSWAVADTNHHRIAAFAVDDLLGPPLWQIHVEAHPQRRFTRIWPSAFAAVGDSWWVIAEDNGMRDGDVLTFTRTGQPLARIGADTLVDPLSLAVLDGDVLVADAGARVLERFHADGSDLGPFGDDSFARDMHELGVRAAHRASLRRWLPALIAIVALAAAVALKLVGEPLSGEVVWSQWEPEKTQRLLSPPVPGAPLWLDPYPDAVARVRRLWLWSLAAMVMAILSLALAIWSVWAARALKHESGSTLVLGIYACMLTLYALSEVLRGPRRLPRVGAHTDAIELRFSNGKAVSRKLSEVYYSNQLLIVGRDAVQLIHPRGPSAYSPEAIRDWVVGRVPKGNFLTQAGVWWHLIRIGHLRTVFASLLLITAVAVIWLQHALLHRAF